MSGAGAMFGGRIDIVKLKCDNCLITLMIVPMYDKYEYTINATTAEERRDRSKETDDYERLLTTLETDLQREINFDTKPEPEPLKKIINELKDKFHKIRRYR